MFGKKGGTAPVALAIDATVEKMRKWHEILVESADASENMADTIDDNLLGSITELKSAWEGSVYFPGRDRKPHEFEQRWG